MKNYVKPEIETLNFETESIMLETLELGASDVNGGFVERT